MKRISAMVITVSFLLFMLLPQFGLLFNIKGEGENLENKSLSSFPKINFESLFSATFSNNLNDYIWDHFPLRSLLLKMDHWIDYHIFSDSPVPSKVLLGKNGWLFLYESVTLWPGQNVKRIKAIKSLVKKLPEIEGRSGKKVILMISPAKASIYSDFLPKTVEEQYNRESVKFRDELEDLSRNKKNLLLLWKPFIKKRGDLLKKVPVNKIEERTRYLYRPRDRHFHWETSLIQAEKVIDFLAPGKWRKGMFNRYLTPYKEMASEMEERFLKISLPEPYRGIKLREIFNRYNLKQINTNFPGTKEVYKTFYSNGSDNFLPVNKHLVIVHDSFMERSKYFIAPFFTKTTYVHWKLNKNFNSFIKVIKDADIVIIQTVEGHLYWKIKRIKMILNKLNSF